MWDPFLQRRTQTFGLLQDGPVTLWPGSIPSRLSAVASPSPGVSGSRHRGMEGLCDPMGDAEQAGSTRSRVEGPKNTHGALDHSFARPSCLGWRAGRAGLAA